MTQKGNDVIVLEVRISAYTWKWRSGKVQLQYSEKVDTPKKYINGMTNQYHANKTE